MQFVIYYAYILSLLLTHVLLYVTSSGIKSPNIKIDKYFDLLGQPSVRVFFDEKYESSEVKDKVGI